MKLLLIYTLEFQILSYLAFFWKLHFVIRQSRCLRMISVQHNLPISLCVISNSLIPMNSNFFLFERGLILNWNILRLMLRHKWHNINSTSYFFIEIFLSSVNMSAIRSIMIIRCVISSWIGIFMILIHYILVASIVNLIIGSYILAYISLIIKFYHKIRFFQFWLPKWRWSVKFFIYLQDLLLIEIQMKVWLLISVRLRSNAISPRYQRKVSIITKCISIAIYSSMICTRIVYDNGWVSLTLLISFMFL